MSSAATSLQQQVPLASSFRDRSGFLFKRDGRLLRQVNRSFAAHYDLFISSGLYKELTDSRLLVTHLEVSEQGATADAYKVIEPLLIPFISFPSEWSFSQLKDAALLTLDLQERALAHGMVLKDASSYNVQFLNGRPIFIDTLSFEKYSEGTPWIAYRQFCQHFLAPLALMAKCDIRLNHLMQLYIDGLPLDMTSALLPWKTKINPGLMLHIHMHARSQSKFADAAGKQTEPVKVARMSAQALRGLLDSLKTTITKLSWLPGGTEWADYYENTNYSDSAMEQKKTLVSDAIQRIRPKMVWDLGANVGVFSEIAARNGAAVLSFDIDPAAVEKNYLRGKQRDLPITPLLMDLTNPTPSYGWAHEERASLEGRGPVDMILALALIHHLAIGNNVPLSRVAEYFSRLSGHLLIEFVPKSDSQVIRLLKSREDIFPDYTPQGFESAFSANFTIVDKKSVAGSDRIMYLMRSRAVAV
ncbi:MAG: class I SAM-dependent methyltransferase [Oligoflexia bacterium]|nr:class I SAM-dependent methyltransferase [Oligoflexia bacterium]